MALTGESLTLRTSVAYDGYQEIPGVQFWFIREVPLNLRPVWMNGKWRVPVITRFEVDNKLNAKSFEGQIIVSGIGGYKRRYLIVDLDKTWSPDYEATVPDSNSRILLETGEITTWGLALTVDDLLPIMNQNFVEEDMAVWIMNDVKLVSLHVQTHEVSLTQAGYYDPNGTIEFLITYHWRTLSAIEFQARKSRT